MVHANTPTAVSYISQVWVIAPPEKVWVMGYERIMGYGVDFPLSRLGKAIILWVIRVYGLREVWVKRVSTVVSARAIVRLGCEVADLDRWMIAGPTRRARQLGCATRVRPSGIYINA